MSTIIEIDDWWKDTVDTIDCSDSSRVQIDGMRSFECILFKTTWIHFLEGEYALSNTNTLFRYEYHV